MFNIATLTILTRDFKIIDLIYIFFYPFLDGIFGTRLWEKGAKLPLLLTLTHDLQKLESQNLVLIIYNIIHILRKSIKNFLTSAFF